MSALKVKGRIFHAAGPWGFRVPVDGATVTITDLDAPGKGDDNIWNGTTDADGRFQGTTSDWKDTTKVTVPGYLKGFPARWIPPHDEWIPDPTDILVLVAGVQQDRFQTTLPFAYINDATPSPDLVVPWPPLPKLLGRVNGRDCYNPVEMNVRIRAAIDSGVHPIKVDIFGPDSTLLAPLLQGPNEVANWVKQKLGAPADIGALANKALGDWVWILVAVAIIILAVGVSVLLLIVGLAILYAIHKGYTKISFSQTTNLP